MTGETSGWAPWERPTRSDRHPRRGGPGRGGTSGRVGGPFLPSLSATGRFGLLAVGIASAVLPFLWMLRTAVGPTQNALGLSANPFPSSVGFGSFENAYEAADLGPALATGIGVSLAILALQLLTAIPAAYAFAWLPFRGRSFLFGVVLATLLVPPQVTAIPNYVTISALGFADTRVGLVLPFMTHAAAIFLLRQYMSTIPPAVLEAARLDGLGIWRTLRTIIVPLSMPAIATVSVFSFLLSFNEYLWPLLVARSPEIATPPLALAGLATKTSAFPDFTQLAAGSLIISLPTLAVFVIAQRRLTAGITGTGVGA